MALIACPECSKKVSELAATCPDCNFPVAKKIAYDEEQNFQRAITSKAIRESKRGGDELISYTYKGSLFVVKSRAAGMMNPTKWSNKFELIANGLVIAETKGIVASKYELQATIDGVEFFAMIRLNMFSNVAYAGFAINGTLVAEHR